MAVQVAVLGHGDPFFAKLLDALRRDRSLQEAMAQEADTYVAELENPTTRWSVVHDGARPLAWSAAVVEADGTLRGISNFTVPELRGQGLWTWAYRERHELVIRPHRGLARTYLYPGPRRAHLADGWRPTGNEGWDNRTGQHWAEFVREC
mgnify:CR=1 FL=1